MPPKNKKNKAKSPKSPAEPQFSQQPENGNQEPEEENLDSQENSNTLNPENSAFIKQDNSAPSSENAIDFSDKELAQAENLITSLKKIAADPFLKIVVTQLLKQGEIDKNQPDMKKMKDSMVEKDQLSRENADLNSKIQESAKKTKEIDELNKKVQIQLQNTQKRIEKDSADSLKKYQDLQASKKQEIDELKKNHQKELQELKTKFEKDNAEKEKQRAQEVEKLNKVISDKVAEIEKSKTSLSEKAAEIEKLKKEQLQAAQKWQTEKQSLEKAKTEIENLKKQQNEQFIATIEGLRREIAGKDQKLEKLMMDLSGDFTQDPKKEAAKSHAKKFVEETFMEIMDTLWTVNENSANSTMKSKSAEEFRSHFLHLFFEEAPQFQLKFGADFPRRLLEGLNKSLDMDGLKKANSVFFNDFYGDLHDKIDEFSGLLVDMHQHDLHFFLPVKEDDFEPLLSERTGESERILNKSIRNPGICIGDLQKIRNRIFVKADVTTKTFSRQNSKSSNEQNSNTYDQQSPK